MSATTSVVNTTAGTRDPMPIVTLLPLRTNFSTGNGTSWSAYGDRSASLNSWSSRSHADVLPLCFFRGSIVVERKDGTRVRATLHTSLSSFHKSDSVLIRGVIMAGESERSRKKVGGRVGVPLYTCRVGIGESVRGRALNKSSTLVSLTFRSQQEASDACLELRLRSQRRADMTEEEEKKSVDVVVLRGVSGSDGIGSGSVSAVVARAGGKIFLAPTLQVSVPPFKEEKEKEKKKVSTQDRLDTMVQRATELRRQGKSEATIVAVLRAERQVVGGDVVDAPSGKEWLPWTTRVWRIPSSVLGGRRTLVSIGVTCVSKLLAATSASCTPYCVQLGELRVEETAAHEGEDAVDEVWSRFRRAKLELNDVMWSSDSEVCFTVTCDMSPADGSRRSTHLRGVCATSMDYYCSTDETPGWKWLGRVTGASPFVYRAMNLVIPQGTDMLVVSGIPSPTNQLERTHVGMDQLYLTLEESPKVVLVVK